MVARLLQANEVDRYDAWVRSHPRGSLWQSREWQRYQQSLGREARTYVAGNGGAIVASASIIIDRTVGGFSTWECPRGPLSRSQPFEGPEGLSGPNGKPDVRRQKQAFLDSIVQQAKQDRCIALYLSPQEHPLPSAFSLLPSLRHIHPEATLMIDLSLSDDQILSRMHPKGRYNIKVAEKQGVTVQRSHDIDAFYALLSATGQRDAFTIHRKAHYARFLDALDRGFLLMATHDNRPIAGLLGVAWNQTGIYYYGASSYEHRNLMAPYALQWAAIRHCKAAGCTTYDLLGIDPPGHATAWAGVTEFKRKFGGKVVTYPAERQLVLRPWVKRGLELKRKIIG